MVIKKFIIEHSKTLIIKYVSPGLTGFSTYNTPHGSAMAVRYNAGRQTPDMRSLFRENRLSGMVMSQIRNGIY